MNKFSILANLVIGVALSSCSNPSKFVQLKNRSLLKRTDELVVFTRAALEKKVGSLALGKFVLFQQAKTPLLAQYDDLDGDGRWDEAALLLDFLPGEKMILQLSVADAPATIKAIVKAHVRHKRKEKNNLFGANLSIDSIPAGQVPTDFSKQALPPFLTEGPSWENDKVGFRLYFDQRNGKDIWGKTTPAMVLDDVGKDTLTSYHHIAEWGMDVLKVGKSLGAGALALQYTDAAGKDTLVRLGGIDMGKVVYEKIADGPVRAIFRMQYPVWKMAASLPPLSLTEEVSIWGGQYFYESKVSVNNAPVNAKLVTGIVNLHDLSLAALDTIGQQVVYTYGVQSENKDKLGMAILFSKESHAKQGATVNVDSDVLHTYTVSFPLDKKPVVFRFVAAWEKSDALFTSEEGFRSYLAEQCIKWGQPLE